MATLCARVVRSVRGAGGRVSACGAMRRTAHTQNGPVRLSRLYVPTLADERVASPETIPSLRRLLRGGYVRQVCISRLFLRRANAAVCIGDLLVPAARPAHAGQNLGYH